MTKALYILWGLLVVAALGVGGASSTPNNAGTVLSAQSVPSPAPFPVRLPGALDPQVQAKYAILIDADSFYPLYKRDAYTAVPIASTTKMMTALLTLERHTPGDLVTISRKASLQIGSTTGLLPGEVLTVGSLLMALLIQSGNDAAYALAEQDGSVEQFVLDMNAKAREIGMRATEFKDPAGLNDDGSSSAFDLAVLAARLIEDKRITGITATPEATIVSTDGRQHHLLKSSNRLVTEELYFPGVMGVKTGFTPAAGHTLVAAAERDGRRLVSVILSTYEDSKDASAKESAKLLNWGFESHRWTGQ